MGGLIGGGRRSSSQQVPETPEPRPMPDPDSPEALRAEREERRKIMARSGRASTDLTRRNGISGPQAPRTPTAMG